MTLWTAQIIPACCLALLLCALGLDGGGDHSAQANPDPAPTKAAKANQELVYIGTYTQKTSKGIYIYNLDLATGRLTPLGVSPDVKDPSFLALHPNHHFLYAVDEIDNYAGTNGGAVTAFSIDPATGALTTLNQQATVGSGPCHLIVDKAGKNVLVANYGGGSVAVLPIDPDGRLQKASAFIQHEGKSVDPARQEGPHAHSANLDASNRFAFMADLGLDKILVYKFDADKGSLELDHATSIAPGSGPRHMAFHPDGHHAYVINEMKCTVVAFDYDAATGALKETQTLSTLPAGVTGKENSTAELQISPDGKFLYGSNRGHNTIAIFSVAPKTGKLTYVGEESTQGKTPRGFAIDPTGQYLIAGNQDSDSVIVYHRDAKTGLLKSTGQTIEVSMPVCVTFLSNKR